MSCLSSDRVRLQSAAPITQSAFQPITVRRAYGEGAFLEFAQTWRALFAASPGATPFQSWEWISTWWRRRGQGEPLLLIACEGEVPVAAMALVKTRYRNLPLYRLRWMGAPDSDYHDFIGGRRRDECAAAFLADLKQSRDWHICELGALRPDLTALLSTELGGPPVFVDLSMSLTLPPDRDAFEQAIGRHRRKGIRHRFSLLKSERGAYSFSTVHARDELQQAMEDLFRLHALRRRMVGPGGGAFADEGMQAFHREVAAAFLERGWLRLHRLSVGDQCIAALYCFHLGGVTYFYQSGFDPDFARYSPGVMSIHHAIGAAIDDGAREFDFLRGDEDYKTRWRAEPRPNGQIVFGRPGFLSQAAVAARRLERTIRSRLKSWRDGDAGSAAADPSHSSNTPSSA